MKRQIASILRHPFVWLAVFVLLLAGARLLWLGHYTPPAHPHAAKGVLDLRGWNFAGSRMIPLDGEWAFYPNRLVTEDELQAGTAGSPVYLQPGEWRAAGFNRNGSSYGYGTYRLRILVDGTPDQPYAFWFDNLRSASRVEINGEAAGGAGRVAAQKRDYQPAVRSYTIAYDPGRAQQIDLLVQVANFDDPRSGGMVASVRFGSQAAIDTERWYSIGMQLVTFVIFLLHVVYALILYAFNPRRKALLVFSLFLICACGTIVTVSDRLLLQWLPLTFTAMAKTALLSYDYTSFFLLSVTFALTGMNARNRWFGMYAAALVLYTVFLIAAPIRAVYAVYPLFVALYLLPVAAVLALFIVKAGRNPRDYILLLMAALAVFSSVVWGGLQKFPGVPGEFYPLDMIAALVALSSHWFRNYFRHANENVRLNEQLRQNDKLKDEFLAQTAHELRTPLHGVIAIAQAVLNEERQSLRPQSAADMELLLTVGRRMSQLINGLLDVARLREKRIQLQPERLLLQSVAPGVFSMLAYLAEDKPLLKLRMDVPESFPPVYADEKRVVQFLFNLLHNAIKYTEAGSIVLSAETDGAMAVVHVADTGIGMDRETQERVFRPYEQGTSRIDGGIGLGLSISKQLTELHGGRLSVRSEPGRGTVFTFTLPLDEGADREAGHEAAAGAVRVHAVKPLPPTAPAGQPSGKGRQPSEQPQAEAGLPSVLLVDDDPVNLKVLASVLPADQYRTVPAWSGNEALERLEAAAFDLAIIDVMMPRMSGYELTREIRRLHSISELPILLLTARSQPEDVYAGFEAGANDYVAKPADPLELKARVWSLTSLKRSVQMSLRMEAAYLQAQIRPHFLFNTLNSLIALSDVDTVRMRKLGEAFTSFLRLSFNFLNAETMVPLAYELELVRAYLYIEKERFGERLAVEWQVEEQLEEVPLPPLIIQPLVENAVRHGLLSRARGGTVRIRLFRLDEGIRVEVEDDGKGMDEQETEEWRTGEWRTGGRK